MYLTALATATPDRRYTKGECWSAFVASDWFLRLDARSRSLAQLVLNRDNGMESRFLAIDSLEEVFAIEADTLQRRFATHAPRLAIEAARVALARADLEPQGIDAVVVTTCTGYLCPGLTSDVIERLGRGVGAVLSSARREGAWQSVGPLRLDFNDKISPGVLAVGNAAVEAPPLVGEGICMALQSAAIFTDLLGMKPRRIDKFPTHQIQERYSRACRVAFARRMHLAQLYAHIAMYRSLAAPVATLMQFWPRMLTRAARLAGKARAGALRVGRQQEIA